jgi:hypothetical protein
MVEFECPTRCFLFELVTDEGDWVSAPLISEASLFARLPPLPPPPAAVLEGVLLDEGGPECISAIWLILVDMQADEWIDRQFDGQTNIGWLRLKVSEAG